MNSCGSFFFFFSVFSEAFTITWLPAQTQLYHSNMRDGPKLFQNSNVKVILLYSLFMCSLFMVFGTLKAVVTLVWFLKKRSSELSALKTLIPLDLDICFYLSVFFLPLNTI